MKIRSRIYMDDWVPNSERVFGESDGWVQVFVHYPDGTLRAAHLSKHAIAKGEARAKNNVEDVYPPVSMWTRLKDWFRGA